MSASALSGALLAWYRSHGRDLPWRRTCDPYSVWVSEVMLQQTQVAAALPYYERWMARFPTVHALASSTEDEALSTWQGLGYYRRCRLFREAAAIATSEGFPTTETGWRELPGVGAYTAAALASICNGEPAPVVDGNVLRAYARLEADASARNALQRNARAWGERHICRESPADWNQAIMELGARICRPRAPLCGECPVSEWCKAFAANHQERYPSRRPKPAWVEVERRLAIVRCGTAVALVRAAAGEWWAGMLRFPFVEETPGLHLSPVGSIRHTVTRHRLTLKIECGDVAEPSDSFNWVERSELSAVPLPSAMRKAWALASG